MKILMGSLEIWARGYMEETIKIARKATCLRRKCGSIIVKDDEIMSEGFNSPVGYSEEERVCLKNKKSLDEKVTDKTCCQHAERRALDNGLDRYNKIKLKDAVIFFASVNNEGEKIFSGKPYCTKCSKDALDLGLKGWILEHEEGLCFYDAKEYDELSRNYS